MNMEQPRIKPMQKGYKDGTNIISRGKSSVNNTEDLYEALPEHEYSPCGDWPEEVTPINSDELYEDFVQRLAEILGTALKLLPCQIKSWIKLAVDMMLATNVIVYADLHKLFVNSLRKLVETELNSVESSLIAVDRGLNPKKVRQIKEKAVEISKQLGKQLEDFDKFKGLNEIDEATKRIIEEKYFKECANSLKREAGSPMKEFHELVCELMSHETTIEVFIRNFRHSTKIVCHFLIQDLQLAQGCLDNMDKFSKKYVKPIEEELERKNRDYFGYVIESLKQIVIEYCSAAGVHHIQTMSILATNILTAKNFNEFHTYMVQLRCFMGRYGLSTRIDLFEKNNSDIAFFWTTGLVSAKLYIQIDCLTDFGIKIKRNSVEEYFKPLSLIDASKLEELLEKLYCQTNGKDHFKRWELTEQREFVSKFMLEAVVAKTGALTNAKGKIKDVIDQRVKALCHLDIQRTAEMMKSESSQYSESDFEIGARENEESDGGRRELHEQCQSSPVEGPEEPEFVLEFGHDDEAMKFADI